MEQIGLRRQDHRGNPQGARCHRRRQNSTDIQITAQDIAENGAVVPVGVVSALSGVEVIALLIEKNPNPLAASFTLPAGTEAAVQTRVKMGQTSDVYRRWSRLAASSS
jgi:predicted secreted protein